MKKITVNHKEYEMQKMSIDDYAEYLEIAEKTDKKGRYTKSDIEDMAEFVCRAYGNQFTVEELKNPDTGIDAAGLILEFQMFDSEVANEISRKMDRINENFTGDK